MHGSANLPQNSEVSTNNENINSQESSPPSSQDTTSKVEIEDINFNSDYNGEVIQTILKKISTR